jgi:hypothetical protein
MITRWKVTTSYGSINMNTSNSSFMYAKRKAKDLTKDAFGSSAKLISVRKLLTYRSGFLSRNAVY